MSLASSINHYRIENNRRYHTYRMSSLLGSIGEGNMMPWLTKLGDGAYWAPHDEEALKLDNYA